MFKLSFIRFTVEAALSSNFLTLFNVRSVIYKTVDEITFFTRLFTVY